MIVALDTNILVDVWANTVQGQRNAQTLHRFQRRGDGLVICGAVYAELCAYPGMTRGTLDVALAQVKIGVDPLASQAIWEDVGRVHAVISQRRRASGAGQARRPLADHIIGAHALQRADALLTRNAADFSDFPTLTVLQA